MRLGLSFVLFVFTNIGPPPEGAPPSPGPKARLTLQADGDAVLSIAFSPDGKTLASGGRSPLVKVWDVATGKQKFALSGHHHWVNCVVFSIDGKLLISGAQDNLIILWDAVTGKEVRRLRGHTDHVISLAVSPDGKSLVSGSRDGTVKLWDLPGRKIRATLEGHSSFVWSLAFTPDSKLLVSSGSWDTTVRVWEVPTGKGNLAFNGPRAPIRSVRFSPDGKTLALGGYDGTARLVEVISGKPRLILKGERPSLPGNGPPKKQGKAGHPGRGYTYPFVCSVAFSPDGRTLVSGGGRVNVEDPEGVDRGELKVWDLATGKEQVSLQGRTGIISAVAFSPDGRLLASASHDGTIRLWETSTFNKAKRPTSGRRDPDAGHGGWAQTVKPLAGGISGGRRGPEPGSRRGPRGPGPGPGPAPSSSAPPAGTPAPAPAAAPAPARKP
jgi:WD40 repeat protein